MINTLLTRYLSEGTRSVVNINAPQHQSSFCPGRCWLIHGWRSPAPQPDVLLGAVFLSFSFFQSALCNIDFNSSGPGMHHEAPDENTLDMKEFIAEREALMESE